MIKSFNIVLFILLLSLPFNVANSDILKFEGGTYEGEVKKVKLMVQENLLFQMVVLMKENLKKINFMEKENIQLNQEKFLKENGDVIVSVRKQIKKPEKLLY